MQSLVEQVSPLMDLSSNIKGGMGGEEERKVISTLINSLINMIAHELKILRSITKISG